MRKIHAFVVVPSFTAERSSCLQCSWERFMRLLINNVAFISRHSTYHISTININNAPKNLFYHANKIVFSLLSLFFFPFSSIQMQCFFSLHTKNWLSKWIVSNKFETFLICKLNNNSDVPTRKQEGQLFGKKCDQMYILTSSF